ncbi:MAG: hypothetical protein AB1801_10140 [Chloroflexota bacterium]
MPAAVEFSIIPGDILSFEADVIALKHAQEFFGVDWAVAEALSQAGISESELACLPNDYRYVNTRGRIQARHALYIGMPPITQIDYQQVKEFAARSLLILQSEAPHTVHLGLTLHGLGFGLDEVEVFLAEFQGCLEAIQLGAVPEALKRITIVELSSNRVERLRRALEQHLFTANYAERVETRWAYRLSRATATRDGHAPPAPPTSKGFETVAIATAVYATKPHAFVAMPFKKEMDDVFYYGIQGPVRSAGYLCERVDQEAFTGDILDRVKQKIETAAVVIADLTGANPNVYLEVGYAWGKGRPTVLVTAAENELKFDVRGQRCLTYERIRDLEEALTRELTELKARGQI